MIYQFDTFINKDPNLIFTDLQDIREDDFLPVDKLHTLNSEDFDSDYVEGALLINVDGKVLSDLKMYDDINWLWPYLLNMTEELLIDHKSHSSFTFPSQPLPVEAKLVSESTINLRFHDRSATLAVQEFYSTVITKGELFFRALNDFFNVADLYDGDFEQLHRLRTVYESRYNRLP